MTPPTDPLPAAAVGAELRRRCARWPSAGSTSCRTHAPTCGDLSPPPAQRRTHYDHRFAVVGRTADELRARLRAFARQAPPSAGRRARRPAARRASAFVFGGQGPQWLGMGRELLAQRAGVPRRRSIDIDRACCALCRLVAARRTGRARGVLRGWTRPRSRSRRSSRCRSALAALWESWGVAARRRRRPQRRRDRGAARGRGADARRCGARRLASRPRHAAGDRRWRMAAVGLIERAGRRAGARPSATGSSSRRSTARAASCCRARRPRSTTRLPTLDGARCRYRAAGATTRSTARRWRRCQRSFVARWRGSRRGAPTAGLLDRDRRARCRRMRSTPPTSAATCGSPCASPRRSTRCSATVSTCFSEIGPHPVLAGAIAESVGAARRAPPCWRRCAAASPNARACCSACAGAYAAGCLPDWAAVHGGPGEVVSLPPYPWQRERHWLRPCRARQWRLADRRRAAPGAGHAAAARRSAARRVRRRPSAPRRPWLADHRIFGRLLMPAMAMIEAFARRRPTPRSPGTWQCTDFAIERAWSSPKPTTRRRMAVGRRRSRSTRTARLELHRGACDERRGATWQQVARARAERETRPICPARRSTIDRRRGDDRSTPRRSTARSRRCGVGVRAAVPRLAPSTAWTSRDRPGLGRTAGECTRQPASARVASGATRRRAAAVQRRRGRACRRCAVARAVAARRRPCRSARRPARRGCASRPGATRPGRSLVLDDRRLATPAGALVAVLSGVRFAAPMPAVAGAGRGRRALLHVVWESSGACRRRCAPTPRPWLLLADSSGHRATGARTRALRSAGARWSTSLPASSRIAQRIEPSIRSDPPSGTGCLAEVASARGRLRGVVHLSSLDWRRSRVRRRQAR